MKTIVITGASDGIGAELARQLAARHGAQLGMVLAARNEERLQLVAAAVARFAGIDALVNNAGISAQALFSDVEAADLGWYEQLMRINFWGAVWCTHAALPFLKQNRGSIVAVSSLAGLIGVPGRTAYSASKFALTGFFEALRAELKTAGVSVTTAYPGVVATQIRYHGFNEAGQAAGSSGLKEDNAMSVETCAHLILQGMESRQREVVMTAQGKVARWLKLLAPAKVEAIALAALKDEVKPK